MSKKVVKSGKNSQRAAVAAQSGKKWPKVAKKLPKAAKEQKQPKIGKKLPKAGSVAKWPKISRSILKWAKVDKGVQTATEAT